MTDTATVRGAAPADAPRLAELSEVLGYPVSAGEMAGRLDRLLGRSDNVVLVAALPSGDVVGWLHVADNELLATGRLGEIVGLVVDAGQRGRGIGRQLLAAAEAWAAERGLEGLHVRSNVVRTQSHPFYGRLGYVRVKTQHAYWKALPAAATLAEPK